MQTDLLVASCLFLVTLYLIGWTIWKSREIFSGAVPLTEPSAPTGALRAPGIIGSLALILVGCIGGWFMWHHLDGANDTQFGIWPLTALAGVWGLLLNLKKPK